MDEKLPFCGRSVEYFLMCVCVCVCVCVSMCAFAHVYMGVYMCVYVCVCVWFCASPRLCSIGGHFAFLLHAASA